MLGGVDAVYAVVVALDKAAISIHCYFAVSRSPVRFEQIFQDCM